MENEVFQKLFEACDADGDGAVSRADIQATLHKLAGKHQGSRALFASADKSGKGALEYEEFVDFLTRHTDGATDTQAPAQVQAELPAKSFINSTGLRTFLAQMLQQLEVQTPQDPYLWMMQYLARNRPRQVAAQVPAPALATGTAKKRKSAKRVNTSAVTRKTPKKLLDIILGKPEWIQVEDPTDERSDIYFVWDSGSFLSRLGHPSVRGTSTPGAEPVPQLPAESWINRCPGMGQLCDKVNMALALRQLQMLWPEKFRFWPKSWLLPAERGKLEDWMGKHKGETIIVKPSDGSLGEGIFLAQNRSDLETKLLARPQWGAGFSALAQRYIPKPLLLDGLKFDLRLYVVLQSTDPLEAYICREGLARFCTSKYEAPTAANANQHYMHLTNFSVNKKSAAFVKAADPFDPASTASKRALSTLMRQLEAHEAAQGRIFDEEQLFESFKEIAVAVLQALAPVLNVTYNRVAKESASKSRSAARAKAKAKAKAKTAKINRRQKSFGQDSGDDNEDDREDEDSEEDSSSDSGFSPKCFQLLGVDVLLDDDLQPWLLEINGRPSMDIDEPVRMCEAPEGMRRCICRDMDGEDHVHLESPVDRYVKEVAMEGALKIVMGRGEETSATYDMLDFAQHDSAEGPEETLSSIAELYEAAGGAQKAFTTYGARKALAHAIEAGLSQHDLDAAVTRWKHQGYRDTGDLEKDKADIGVFDFASLLQEVSVVRLGGKLEEETPMEALESLLAECQS